MNKKLTLKLNKTSIERAKIYALKNNKSLSIIVENYFNMITESKSIDEFKISPNILELSGIIKLDTDFDLKKTYGKHLEEKYY